MKYKTIIIISLLLCLYSSILLLNNAHFPHKVILSTTYTLI